MRKTEKENLKNIFNKIQEDIKYKKANKEVISYINFILIELEDRNLKDIL